jgi:hypothetical protein
MIASWLSGGLGMVKLSYPRIQKALNDLAADRYIGNTPFVTSVVIDSDDTWLGTWSNEHMYVLVQASLADPGHGRTLVDVHACGAYGLMPKPELFETLSEATWRLDYGGPWSRRLPDHRVTFGWRARYPSELFHEENFSESFGFLTGMIWEFGRVSFQLAEELLPLYGGVMCRAGDPDAWKALISGLLPPQ